MRSAHFAAAIGADISLAAAWPCRFLRDGRPRPNDPMHAETLLLALGLVFIIEGLLPFLAPGAWQRWMQQIAQQSPASVRGLGLISILLGLALLWLW